MFRKTLIATVAAAIVSLGALGATTTTASAHNWDGDGWSNNSNGWNGYPRGNFFGGGFGGNGIYFNFGFQQPPPVKKFHPKPAVQKVCSPRYKTITVWDPHYGWVYQTVYAGQKCDIVKVYPNYQAYPVYRNW